MRLILLLILLAGCYNDPPGQSRKDLEGCEPTSLYVRESHPPKVHQVYRCAQPGQTYE